MRQTSFAGFHCSLARSLEVMGDWWTPLILRDIGLGVDRFDDLAADLGISRNLLARRLAGLVDNGLLEPVGYSEHPPRQYYRLTRAGGELLPVLAALTAWGDRWQTPPGGPPLRFEHAGHECRPEVTCSDCGEALTVANLEPRPGPGAVAAPGTAVVVGRVGARRASIG
jgi:DNA-binding HxlR family transcriptional regulator